MKIKKIFILFAVLFMIPVMDISFSAHSQSQKGLLLENIIPRDNYGYGYFIGGDYVGWSIDETGHTNGQSIVYQFDTTDPNLTDYHKAITRSGASLWANWGISIVEGFSTQYIVGTYVNTNTNVTAALHLGNRDSNGHWLSWALRYNVLASGATNITAAHEFGHVLGLNDLYGANSTDKLMYGVQAQRLATSPTYYDYLGASVITGSHTYHTWSYKYHSTYNASSIQTYNVHVRYCTTCQSWACLPTSYNTPETAICTYNTSNVCIYCGIPRGYQPLFIRYPELAS